MTALAAFLSFESGDLAVADRNCRRLLAAQAMYGQSESVVGDGDVVLGRRLHPLLPEDRFDRGIAIGRESGLLLAADIRLDNRSELSRTLSIRHPEGLCDAEIALLAFERWGDEAVGRLVGDFALILWNARDRSLLLARDFLGNRPLHFHRGRDFLAVASMPKGLHAIPSIPKAVDQERMLDMLALIPPAGTETYFEGIERVEPSTFVKITGRDFRTTRYWNAPSTELPVSRPSDVDEMLRERLDEAVGARLRSLGSIGSHLSSGLDSSAVTTSAALQLGAKGQRLAAFTAVPRPGFDDGGTAGRPTDESSLAALTSALYPNVDHLIVHSGNYSPLDYAERYVQLNDRPPLNLCTGTWGEAISDAARRRGITVMLTAQGGNMTLSFDGASVLSGLLSSGGYSRWARESFALMSGGLSPLKVLWMSVAPLLPPETVRRIRRLRGRLADLEDYSAVRSDPQTRSRLEKRAKSRGLDFRYPHWRDGRVREWVLRRTDFGNYAKGALAGFGIDHRDPTTDRRLIEFCWSLPSQAYLRGGNTRALARSALAPRLPDPVINSQVRGLQAADWYMPLVEDRDRLVSVTDRLCSIAGIDSMLEVAALRDLARSVPNDRWNEPATVARYRMRLLRALGAATFVRQVSGSNV